MQTHVHTWALTNSDQSLGDFLCHAGSFLQRGCGCKQTMWQTTPPPTVSFYAPLFCFAFNSWKDALDERERTISGFRVKTWAVACRWLDCPPPARTVFIDCSDSPEVHLDRGRRWVCTLERWGGEGGACGVSRTLRSTHRHWTQTGVNICRRERQRDPTSHGSQQKEPIDCQNFFLICLKTSRLEELYSGYFPLFLQLQPLQYCVPRFPLRCSSLL